MPINRAKIAYFYEIMKLLDKKITTKWSNPKYPNDTMAKNFGTTEEKFSHQWQGIEAGATKS